MGRCFEEETKERRRKNREQGQAQKKIFEKKYNEYLKTGKKE